MESGKFRAYLCSWILLCTLCGQSFLLPKTTLSVRKALCSNRLSSLLMLADPIPNPRQGKSFRLLRKYA